MRMVRPQFSHVGVHVHDIDAMQAFYQRVFGLVLTDEGSVQSDDVRVAFMSSSPDEHHQVLLVTGRASDAGTKLINQLSFRVDDLEALKSFHTHLIDEGVDVERTITHGTSWSLYFHDPEGNHVEVYCPTDWYVHQPFAAPIDLDADVDEIVARTRRAVEGQGAHETAAEFRTEMEARLGG